MITRPYRYSKDSVAVEAEDTDNGFKRRESWLIEACGGRYVGRAKAYVISKSKLPILQFMVDNGWSAKAMLIKQSPIIFTDNYGNNYLGFARAKRTIKNLIEIKRFWKNLV